MSENQGNLKNNFKVRELSENQGNLKNNFKVREFRKSNKTSVKVRTKLIKVSKFGKCKGCECIPAWWSAVSCIRALLYFTFIFRLLVRENLNFCQGKVREFHIQKFAQSLLLAATLSQYAFYDIKHEKSVYLASDLAFNVLIQRLKSR